MSLSRMVVDLIRERGCGTVDHLMPDLIDFGYTRKQVIKALMGASQAGILWCEGKASRKGKRRTDWKPAVYWPIAKKPAPTPALKPAEPRPLIASVFDLAHPQAWPDCCVGTVYRPLGGWTEGGV